MLVLLYGSENWILTGALLKKLEAFQGKLVKKVLKWPKHHSNTAAIATLDVPTMKCRVLVKKLGFLKRLMGRDTDSLSGCVVLALCNEVDSICLVRECRELEESFETRFIEAITSKNLCCLRQMKKVIMEVERRRMLERCEEKAPMTAKVAECSGWAKLWDHALDLG